MSLGERNYCGETGCGRHQQTPQCREEREIIVRNERDYWRGDAVAENTRREKLQGLIKK